MEHNMNCYNSMPIQIRKDHEDDIRYYLVSRDSGDLENWSVARGEAEGDRPHP